MKLQFKEEYLSISQFNELTIEDFTVLTGVNGSGKSHLLQAIEQKKVIIQGMANPNIVLFNLETFKLENEGAYTAHQISGERDQAWNYFETHVKRNVAGWKSGLGEGYKTLSATCTEAEMPLWDIKDNTPILDYKKNVRNFFSNPNVKNNQNAIGIYSLMQKLPYSIDEINKETFVTLYKPFSYKNDFLPQALGKIVWDYYVKYRENQVNEFENNKYNRDYPVLSEDKFILKHGEKPWELINKILERFDTLDYRVNSPEGVSCFGNFQLNLMHTKKSGLQINFSNLSSGERVLMALVASVYKTASDNYFPDILLLDELDASLHPSMMKNMLKVIQDIFLDRGIKVILVTHSPTTVALSPEQSIFIMNKTGANRIEKKSRQEALSILTEGFATLDQGLMIFDEVTQNQFSIITEGRNTKILEKACALFGHSDVKVISGVEGSSGKNQLKTLFDFFSRIPHRNTVIFIWDCDVTYTLGSGNNTHPIIIEKNNANSIARTGLENIFPEALFETFKKTITLSNGTVKAEFDETRKRDFEAFVLGRNDKSDFVNFVSLFQKISLIKSQALQVAA